MPDELQEALARVAWPDYLVNGMLLGLGAYLAVSSGRRLISGEAGRRERYVAETGRLVVGAVLAGCATFLFLAIVARFMPLRVDPRTCNECLVVPRVGQPLALSVALLFLVGAYLAVKGILGLSRKTGIPLMRRRGMMARLAAGVVLLLMPSMVQQRSLHGDPLDPVPVALDNNF